MVHLDLQTPGSFDAQPVSFATQMMELNACLFSVAWSFPVIDHVLHQELQHLHCVVRPLRPVTHIPLQKKNCDNFTFHKQLISSCGCIDWLMQHIALNLCLSTIHERYCCATTDFQNLIQAVADDILIGEKLFPVEEIIFLPLFMLVSYLFGANLFNSEDFFCPV